MASPRTTATSMQESGRYRARMPTLDLDLAPLDNASPDLQPRRGRWRWAPATPSSLRSDDEWRDSSSSSDGEGDSDSDSGPGKDIQSYALPQEHPLQRHRPELLPCAQNQLKDWSRRVEYHAPPRSRSRISRWNPEPLFPEEIGETPNMGPVGPPRRSLTRRHFHLACPFHASDPGKYKRCLILHDQQSIEGLIDHITRHHTKPFYCARCSETFDTAMARDDHILAEKCKLLDLKPMEGIDQYQKSRLWKRDRWYLDERKRWRRIWNTVFPSQPPRSPYLDQGLGLEVSMARDFWDIYGRRCVSEFLSSRGCLDEDGGDDEKALNALCDLALEDLLEGIISGNSCVPTF